MRTNIKEILEEYRELKEITEKLRKDADAIITRSEKADGKHKDLKSESDKLREALYDVSQKSKSDIENAINSMKKELKGELTRELDKFAPDCPPEKVVIKTKELALSDEHINVLHQLASLKKEISLTDLYDHYFRIFPKRERKDFQVVIGYLIENNLIREAYAEAGDYYYTISNEGILHLQNRKT